MQSAGSSKQAKQWRRRPKGTAAAVLSLLLCLVQGKGETFVRDALGAETARVLQKFSEASRKPFRECPRMNGRFGYYANPWCSSQEQALWDRWDAHTLRRSKQNKRPF